MGDAPARAAQAAVDPKIICTLCSNILDSPLRWVCGGGACGCVRLCVCVCVVGWWGGVVSHHSFTSTAPTHNRKLRCCAKQSAISTVTRLSMWNKHNALRRHCGSVPGRGHSTPLASDCAGRVVRFSHTSHPHTSHHTSTHTLTLTSTCVSGEEGGRGACHTSHPSHVFGSSVDS
jgi:hypothetical protein